MPIYEFVCQACQNLVEILVKNPNQEIELKCAACGSSELQRAKLNKELSFLRKPFTSTEMNKKIRELLDKKKG